MRSYWMQMNATETVLEMRDVPVPEPGPGQMLVEVRAASLNRGEFVIGHGLHGTVGSSKAIGGEAAGEIVKVGADAGPWQLGDRVMGRCVGAFSQWALLNAEETMAVPESLSWEEASALPLTFLVAFDMLVLRGHLEPGEWLLVNGVTSGVGVASLQLGKVLGARVIGTSGSERKLETVRRLGLDVALCTQKPDFGPAVMEATAQHGADLIVNVVGGSVFAENIRVAAFEGRLATVGYVDGVLHADLDLGAVHAKRLTLFGVSNKLRTRAQRAAAIPRFVDQIMPHVAAGRIKPQVDRVFDFSQLAEAKRLMESGGHVGKIVLRVEAAS
jgi:NADPH2:quinone reductase